MAKRRKPQAYIVYLCSAVAAAFGRSTVWTVSSVYQVEIVKLSPLQLVLVGTILEVVTFLLQVPTGALADLYSRRLSVITGYTLLGTSYLLQGLFPHFEVILLAQIVLAAGYTFVGGAEEAWITSEIGDELAGKAFLRATQWSQVGSLVAVPFGLALANVFQLSTPMVIGAGILILLGICLCFWMPENHFQPTTREERTTWKRIGQQMVAGYHTVRTSSMLLCILAVTLFMGLSSEGLDRLSIAHFLTDLTLPALWGLKDVTWFGIISIVSTLLTIIVSELLNRTVDTNKPRAVVLAMLILNVLLIVSVAIFGLAGNFYVALTAFWCATVIRSVRNPLHNTWITQNTRAKQRATIFSFDGMVDPIGQIAGGPLVGAIGEWFSLRIAMLAVSLIMTPALLFLGKALELSKHNMQVEEAEEDASQDITA